jgi:hypothetical protein
LILLLLATNVSETRSTLFDLEASSENDFQAWKSTKWVQTSQADFEAGVADQVDTTSNPGDVQLATIEPSVFYSSGNLSSQVLDTTAAGAVCNAVFWNETLESDTDITFEVRASDTVFLKDAATPSWNYVGGTSPILSGLPSGRYMQWRAILSTSNSTLTPTLHEVRLYHY